LDEDFKWGIQILNRTDWMGIGVGLESICKDKLGVNEE